MIYRIFVHSNFVVSIDVEKHWCYETKIFRQEKRDKNYNEDRKCRCLRPTLIEVCSNI